MTRLFLLLLCCSTLTFAQSREFKKLVMEGLESYENKNYAAALDAYTKAYALEVKADIIRLEGTFTAPYLPCYSIALAHEGLGDILEADAWVQRSKSALESDAISSRKRELATYKQDVARIEKAASQKRDALEAEFKLALNKANDLLDQNRFDQARSAFEALYRTYPDRNEPKLGLDRIRTRRSGYLRELALNIREATMNQNFNKADALLDQYRQIDPSSNDLPGLVASVNTARDRANKPAEPEPQPVQTVVRKEVKEPTGPSPEELERRRKLQAERTRLARLERNKADLRSALIDTLRPYRRGEPGDALRQLQQIDVDGAETFSSYQWLKGLYLLANHEQSLEPESDLLMQAREAMANTKRLQPDFSPDPKLYPQYVIAFYEETAAAGEGDVP